MLAADSAWAILRAEHTRMRELLVLVGNVLEAADGRPAQPQALALIELIERLEDFEEATHRPKGVVLLGILRGRSTEVDELLDQLEAESRRCNELLLQAKALLKLAGSGDLGAATAVESLLGEHRRLLEAHLDREDTLLHSQTALLLTGDEWALVVSSMSAAINAAKQRDRARQWS